MALLLLDSGAPLDGLSHDGLMALVVNSNSVAVLTRLLARSVDNSALRDWNDCTLCHFVTQSAKRDTNVSPLLRAVVDAARVDVSGRFPWCGAASLSRH